MRSSETTRRFVGQLFEAVYVWSRLRHPNVLSLLGFAFCNDTGYPMLISRWMDRGSAWKYVSEHPHLTIVERGLLVRACRNLHLV